MHNVWLILCLSSGWIITSAGQLLQRTKRNGLFPQGSSMGVYLALALPVDLPQYEIAMSFNFEGNYNLPSNATELAYGPEITVARSVREITRRRMYTLIEEHLEKGGFVGRTCLLRAICESSAEPIVGHNGLLGELIHIIFTPSTTTTEDALPNAYVEAEELGTQGSEKCARSYNNCPLNIYDLFTVWSR